MPRSNERRTKGEAVEEEFPFLTKIVSPEDLKKVLAETGWSGFLVRRIRESFLFEKTDHRGDKSETWFVREKDPSSVWSPEPEKLPDGKLIWEVFPYTNEYAIARPRCYSLAFVCVYRDSADVPPSRVVVYKMPRRSTYDGRSFYDTLTGIRMVAKWPRWQLYNHEPHPDNVEYY